MKLRELFDNPVPFTVESSHDYGYEASFKVGDEEYTYTAYMGDEEENQREYPGDEREAEIEFCKIVDGYCDQGISKGQNPHQVFSTVVSITRDLMSKHPVMALIFSAKEDNRKNLYLRMAKKLLPTWSIKEHGGKIIVSEPKPSHHR